jgi:predicted MPP superfamily phosphohydrolase
MLKWRMFLTFFTMVLLIMGGVHGYLFARLVVGTEIPSPWREISAAVLVIAVLSVPFSFLAGRILKRGVARFVVIPVYVWMGFIFQTLFLVLAADLLHGLGWVTLRIAGIGPVFGGPEQALLAWRVVAGSLVALSLGATAFAIWWGVRRTVVRKVEVVLPGLPEGLDGFTLLQLSDLHLDLVHGGKWLEKIVERANALEPDLIALTGDLAEGSVAQFGHDARHLRDLAAPHGVFFVTGNHEYFHDLDGWLAFLAESGIRVLRNQRVAIGNGRETFDLLGVDDHDGGRIAMGHGPDLEKSLEGSDPARARVLLAHQPRIIEEASRKNIGLVLSGHTHGGQIWPFSYLVYLQQPYVKGLILHKGTQLYISSGTGFWGPPMRLGTTAEISLITLRSPGRQEVQG